MGVTKCSLHGLQGFCFVSPDLVASPLTTDLRPFLKRLMNGVRVEFCVTLSTDFAQQHGLDRSDIPTEEALGWFITLRGMCGACYRDRWPHLCREADAEPVAAPDPAT
jgi:hypothetical protein